MISSKIVVHMVHFKMKVAIFEIFIKRMTSCDQVNKPSTLIVIGDDQRSRLDKPR